MYLLCTCDWPTAIQTILTEQNQFTDGGVHEQDSHGNQRLALMSYVINMWHGHDRNKWTPVGLISFESVERTFLIGYRRNCTCGVATRDP